MTRCFQSGIRAFAYAGAIVLFTLCGSAQEGSRTLTGNITSGYSLTSSQGDNLQGPYFGIDADLLGYWKDPRILQYEVTPNFASGFQWTGPMNGPQTTGIAANATFLDGSRFPASFYFSRQSFPATQVDMLPGADTNTQGRFASIGRIRQDWGVDWSYHGARKYPNYRLHYSNSDSTDEYPVELGGNVDSRLKNLWMETDYVLAGWQLNGRFSDVANHAQSLFLVDANGDRLTQSTADREYLASATHKLPLDSQVSFTADKHQSTYDFANGISPTNDYSRFAAYVSTRPWWRLSLSAGESYVTSYADFVRSQLLSTGTVATPTSALLVPSQTSVLSNSETATFTIVKGLIANGSFTWTQGLDNPTGIAPDTRSIGGGLSYTRRLFGGDASAAYSYVNTTANGAGLEATLTTTTGGLDTDSTSHSVSFSYGHALPWQLKMTASTGLSMQDATGLVPLSGHTATGNIEVSRHIGAWNVTARTSYMQQLLDSSTNNKTTAASFGFNANTKTIQLSMVDSYSTGLAYIFGNNVIVAPVGVLNPAATGLPFSNYTSGNTFLFNGSYQVSRRLFVRGMWGHGYRNIVNATPSNYGSYSFGVDYRIRQITVGAGYARTVQHVDNLSAPDMLNRQIYFQIRRQFRVF